MMINQIITTTTTKKTVKAIWEPEIYKQNNSKQTLQTTFTTVAEIQNDGPSEQF